MLADLANVNRFFVQGLAGFLKRLASTKEGDGTMLDRTIVLFGKGSITVLVIKMVLVLDNHHLPILLAGGRKLGIKQGQFLRFDDELSPTSHHGQGTGPQVESFGRSTGVLPGLLCMNCGRIFLFVATISAEERWFALRSPEVMQHVQQVFRTIRWTRTF